MQIDTLRIALRPQQPPVQITAVEFLRIVAEMKKLGFFVDEMRSILGMPTEEKAEKERNIDNFVQCLEYVRDTYAEKREKAVINKLVGRLRASP